MAYLVCDKCGGYYELQPDESPNDFTDKCECGGNLKYVQNLDDVDDLQKTCPNCGSIIEDNDEVCPVCGHELKKSPVTEKQLIFGLLWDIPALGFFTIGFIVSVYMLGIIIAQIIFNPQSTPDFYSALWDLLIVLIFPIICLVVVIALIAKLKSKYLNEYEKKNLNWGAIIIAFMVTMVISIFGRYLPNIIFIGPYLLSNAIFIGPLIGGFISGCIVGKNYINGFVHGGIPAGIAGLIGAPLLMLLLGNEMPALSNTSPEKFLIVALVIATIYFTICFLFGSISGIIGADIRKRISS